MSATKTIEPPKQFGDVTAKHGVQIEIGTTGLVSWINIDGVCVLRIVTTGFIPIEITDKRIDKRVDYSKLEEIK